MMNEELFFILVLGLVFIPFTVIMDRFFNGKWFWQKKEKGKVQPSLRGNEWGYDE